jgi:hypothetical protein
LKLYYVYVYLRRDGTPYYVGKGCGPRAWVRRKNGVNPPLDRTRIRIVKAGLREQEAFEWECDIISILGRVDLGTGCLRNKTDGGEGSSGAVKSEETRNKLSVAMSGENNPQYGKLGGSHASANRIVESSTRQKISEYQTGRERSKETRSKISESTMGVKNHRYGERDSDEVRKKKSDSHKGKLWWVNKEGKTTQSAESPGQEWKRGRVW